MLYKNKINHAILNLIFVITVTICSVAVTKKVILTAASSLSSSNYAIAKPSDTKDYSQYGIGSVSKIFGAVAVMKLVDDGKIDLDTPLTYYIPEFYMADDRYKLITPKMLLNHSSGIMGTTFHNGFVYGTTDSNYHDTFLEQLKDQELKADPGEYSVYCNDGFTLAEILVERVSGMSFSEFLNKEICKPLNLTNTHTPMERLDKELLAPVYLNGHKLPYVNCSMFASGGIYGTSEDLCRFSQVFMKNSNEIVISKNSAALMAKAWYKEDSYCVKEGDSQIGYGLGWDCVNTYPYNLYDIKALTKGGDVNGYHSNLTVLPEQNLSIALTASGGTSSNLQAAAQDILLEVLKEEGIIEDIKDIKIQSGYEVTTAPLPDGMKQYAGYYNSQSMLMVEFSKEGTLYLTPLDSEHDTTQEYVYTKSGEFVSTKGYYLDGFGNFVSNANGNKGMMKISFRKESNGKTYIMGTTYESTMGLGEVAYTTAFAEKIEANSIEESVLKHWQERENKKYYLVGEVYNSEAFFSYPSVRFELINEIRGYVTSYIRKKSKNKCRIINKSTANCEIDLPGMVGRDLTNYIFTQNENAEYVSIGSFQYICNDAVLSTDELTTDRILINNDLTNWYEVSKADSGTLMQFDMPANSAYYVYDKDDNCISSSLFQDEVDWVLLPSAGHIVFAGQEGSLIRIKRK